MKKLFTCIVFLIAFVGLVILTTILLRPRMDRWGASDAEVTASIAGDELVPHAASTSTRVITINASPQQVYPWLLQMGGDRGGLYSYTWLEKLMACPLVNADRIHPEWQDLKVGDQVKMCPGDAGPEPFEVAMIVPDHALILGHRGPDGAWTSIWQFVLIPAGEGATRLIQRSRDSQAGGIWDVLYPGIFIMQRGMLLGIKERVENTSQP